MNSKFLYYDQLFSPTLVLDDKFKIVYFNYQASIFFKLPPRVLKQKEKVKELIQSEEFSITDWLSSFTEEQGTLLSPEIGLTLTHDQNTRYDGVLKLCTIQVDQTKFMALFIHDLSIEKKLYNKYREQLEELKNSHEQVMQADKLKTIGELTASISHEINNPLTIAIGNSEIIDVLISSPLNSKNVSIINSSNQVISESLERINQIIKNMMSFLHKSEEDKEFCNIESVINNAVEWISPANFNVTIEKEFVTKNCVALVNKTKMEQVFINLIKNSIDAFTEAKIYTGKLKLKITQLDLERHIIIDIIDNGPGIPTDLRENIFTPFFTTKKSGAGTGLGLSICSKIIESHHGTIELMPTTSGTHFRIQLPMIEGYTYSRNNSVFRGQASGKQKKILVLNNEVEILNILSQIFKAENYIFIGSTDPQHALDFLNKADLDLIITDYSMPKMTGDIFAQKCREMGFLGPIMYMTSAKYIEKYNQDKDKEHLKIQGVIVQPFTKEEVLKAIKTAITGESA